MTMHPTEMFSTKRFIKKCEMSDLIIFSNIMMSEKFMNNFLLTI